MRPTLTLKGRKPVPDASALPEGDFIPVLTWCHLNGGMHPGTFYKLAAEGKMPKAVKGIPRAEALEWLAAQAGKE